ncbi:hypothetical protein cyc_02973 [Cyclospora cayetanensis]|uniref:Uncharacterized protein n=1 Tax=Cyclospora cayetanensis TaxID=88456 RepID=A0A1D3CWX1_9EIME|nr:hypothetical protein cyc_02973 [Cyclospora cayetanensis]
MEYTSDMGIMTPVLEERGDDELRLHMNPKSGRRVATELTQLLREHLQEDEKAFSVERVRNHLLTTV